MVPQFEATIFDLHVGDVSEIFETTYGFHIIKLLERKGNDYKCQHILIIPEFANNALEQAALRLDSCYNDLKAGKISVTSPIGKGILGKKVGETAEVQAPAGTLNFRIDSITTG